MKAKLCKTTQQQAKENFTPASENRLTEEKRKRKLEKQKLAGNSN